MRIRDFVNEVGYVDPAISSYLEKRRHSVLGQGSDQYAFQTPTGHGVLKVFGGNREPLDAPGATPAKTPSQRMYETWVNLCVRNSPHNPFLPRFFRMKNGRYTLDRVYRGRLFIISFQERLQENKPLAQMVANFAGDIVRFNNKELIMEFIQSPNDPRFRERMPEWLIARLKYSVTNLPLNMRPLQHLTRTIIELNAISEQNDWNWDLHSGNVMARGTDTPVLADPWHTWREEVPMSQEIQEQIQSLLIK